MRKAGLKRRKGTLSNGTGNVGQNDNSGNSPPSQQHDQAAFVNAANAMKVEQQRKPSNEEAILSARNNRLAKELNELRVRLRDETKAVTRLTMENMNLATRCREAINHVAILRKELSITQQRAAEAILFERENLRKQLEEGSDTDRIPSQEDKAPQSPSGFLHEKEKDKILSGSPPPPPPPPPPHMKTNIMNSDSNPKSSFNSKTTKNQLKNGKSDSPNAAIFAAFEEKLSISDAVEAIDDPAEVASPLNKSDDNIPADELLIDNSKMNVRKNASSRTSENGTSEPSDNFSLKPRSKVSSSHSYESNDSQTSLFSENKSNVGNSDDFVLNSFPSFRTSPSPTSSKKADKNSEKRVNSSATTDASTYSQSTASLDAFEASFTNTFPTSFSSSAEDPPPLSIAFDVPEFSDPFFLGSLDMGCGSEDTGTTEGNAFGELSSDSFRSHPPPSNTSEPQRTTRVKNVTKKSGFGFGEMKDEKSPNSTDNFAAPQDPSYSIDLSPEQSGKNKGKPGRTTGSLPTNGRIDPSFGNFTSSPTDLFPSSALDVFEFVDEKVAPSLGNIGEDHSVSDDFFQAKNNSMQSSNIEFNNSAKASNRSQTNNINVSNARSSRSNQRDQDAFGNVFGDNISRIQPNNPQHVEGSSEFYLYKNDRNDPDNNNSGNRRSQKNKIREVVDIDNYMMDETHQISSSSSNSVTSSSSSQYNKKHGLKINVTTSSRPSRDNNKQANVHKERRYPPPQAEKIQNLPKNEISDKIGKPHSSPRGNMHTHGTQVSTLNDTSSVNDHRINGKGGPSFTPSVLPPQKQKIVGRRNIRQPVSYAEPSLNSKLRRGDVYFVKKDSSELGDQNTFGSNNSISSKQMMNQSQMTGVTVTDDILKDLASSSSIVNNGL